MHSAIYDNLFGILVFPERYYQLQLVDQMYLQYMCILLICDS